MATAKATQPSNGGRKARKREQEVLDAAAEIFYQRGYPDATVQDVADALGILKGSLYYYIETKEDLLFRLLEQVHDEVDEILQATIAEPDLAPLQRLETYVRRSAEYNINNLVKITVYYHDVDRLSADRHQSVFGRRKAHEEFVTGLIRQAQADGTVDATQDPRLLGNCVFSTIIWTYRWYNPRGRYRAGDIADLCARFAISGVVGAPIAPPPR